MWKEIEKKSKKNDKYLDLAKEQKKAVNHESDDCSWCPWNNLQRPGKETKETGKQWKNRNHPEHSIGKIS